MYEYSVLFLEDPLTACGAPDTPSQDVRLASFRVRHPPALLFALLRRRVVSQGVFCVPPTHQCCAHSVMTRPTPATLSKMTHRSMSFFPPLACVAHRRLMEIVRLGANLNLGSCVDTELGRIMTRDCLGFRVCFPPRLNRHESYFPMLTLNQTPQPLMFAGHESHAASFLLQIAQTS